MRKWRDRFAGEGLPGLADGSSRPHRSPIWLAGHEEEEIGIRRRQHKTGPAIARQLRRPLLTVEVVRRRRSIARTPSHRVTGNRRG